jgi:hypothetical protein
MLLGALVILTRTDRAVPGGPAHQPRAPTVEGHAAAPIPGGAGAEPVTSPAVSSVTVTGLQATLAWAWTPVRGWDHLALRLYLGSHDLESGRFTDEEMVTEKSLRDHPAHADGTLRGSLSHRLPRAGLYSFRLEIISRSYRVTHPARGSGHEMTWRGWQREKVLVGAEGWSIVPLPGLHGDLRHDARDPRFAVFFELYHGPTLVRDCGLDYQVGWPAATHAADCDWETGERSVILDNPTPGTPGAWLLSLRWPGQAPFGSLRLESDLRDNGVRAAAPRTAGPAGSR